MTEKNTRNAGGNSREAIAAQYPGEMVAHFMGQTIDKYRVLGEYGLPADLQEHLTGYDEDQWRKQAAALHARHTGADQPALATLADDVFAAVTKFQNRTGDQVDQDAIRALLRTVVGDAGIERLGSHFAARRRAQ